MGILGGSSSSSSKSKTYLGKQGRKYIFPMLDNAMGLMEDGAPGFYPFDTVANLDPYQMAGVEALAGSPAGDISQLLYGSGAQGLDILNQYYGNPTSAPQITNENIANFFDSDLVGRNIQTLSDASQHYLDRYLGNDIAGASVATGNTGSSRRGAMEGAAIGKANIGFQQGVTDILNNARGDAINLAGTNANLEADANRLRSGDMGVYSTFVGNNLGNAVNLNANYAQNLLSAGGVLQDQAQREIGGDMQEHMWDYQMGWDPLTRYYGLASPMYNMTNTYTKSKSSQTPGLAQVATQLGAAYLSGGASLAMPGGMPGSGGGFSPGGGSPSYNPYAGTGVQFQNYQVPALPF